MFPIQNIKMRLQVLKMLLLKRIIIVMLSILTAIIVIKVTILFVQPRAKKQQYAVFDEKYKLIKSYSGDVVDQQVCINAFKEKYKQEPSEVSVGYENEIFVYCLMYQGKDSLVYAFYGIDNGEFVKAYRIDNG